MASKAGSPNWKDNEELSPPTSHFENSGGPDVTERTPLLAGPSCIPVSSCCGMPPKSSELHSYDSLDSCQCFESSDRKRDALCRSSQSQGYHDDSEGNSSTSSTTIHTRSEVRVGSSDSLTIAPRSRPLLFSLPQGISLRLENSGSVARDHLASERTFLAYMRTSLAIASSGVALVQLFSAASAAMPKGSIHRLQHYIRPLGASTVLIGLLVLLIGVARYFTIQAALMKGYFPVAHLTTGFIAVVLTTLVTLTFAILIAGKLEVKQA
ncbi:hypothetical protein CPB84DRAFT_1766697 [Gymnopilus junonius]|uniref:DUF202 domain-containing protein n=1 Tax=Gymnopilus junonius TaxID=109634 RepID=A0A9P5NWF7_GYMJU|nr:hypothetical protein CPB84DRAFT_1766697 [Gymnopilus junonius]